MTSKNQQRSSSFSSSCSTDIEDLHRLALLQKSKTYIDPATGFTVFTEYQHLKRGRCCGNRCRHCPYGWENVQLQDGSTRQAKVKSGDIEGVQRLLERIENGTFNEDETTSASQSVASQPTQSPVTPPPSSYASRGKGGRFGGASTSKNVPYTRKGDTGTAQLLSGERRSKADDAFEAMGTVDELCSVVGVVHAELPPTSQHEELREMLLEIMSRLFDIGSHVAKPRKDLESDFEADGIGGGFAAEHIDDLEDWMDDWSEEMPELTSFVLPTGTRAAAQLHIARTVCRRAERRVVPLAQAQVCDPHALKYINRLSDFFFVAARYVNFLEGVEEYTYKRPHRGATQRQRVQETTRRTTSFEEEKKCTK